jgi:hypothetical protein
MQPWKMFVRSVSVVTLLTAGGFAAGQDVLPFANVSRGVAPQVFVADDTALDATAADATDTPVVDPAAEVGEADSSTTTTTAAPAADTPTTDTPATDPAPIVPVVDVPKTVVTPPATPAPDSSVAPPATPAENDAPAVCAAAAESPCGPPDPAPAAALTTDERVQRCQDWWNRLADRLQARRPAWAERARRVAERCEAIVARWEDRHAAKPVKQDKPAKMKGDHNCDDRPDNGWHNNRHKTPPAECPPQAAPAPAPAPQGKGRPQTSPGHVKHGR